MARKLSDLKDFINYLKKIGYRNQIHINHLRYFIAQKVGTSEYVMKNYLRLLLEFGFIKEVGIGVYQICDGWNPVKTKEETLEAERLARKEADELLKKVEDANSD